MMKGNIELKYNLKKIDDFIRELHSLENRAAACSNYKYEMQSSDGDPKTAFIDAYKSVTDCSASIAILISNTIEYLNYAKHRMQHEDDALKGKVADYNEILLN